MARRMAALCTVAVLTALAVAGPVAAGGSRWTRGDAEAMLRTYPASGEVHFPLPGEPGLDIRPFQDFYGDVVYCVDDWHVVALEWDEAQYSAPDGTVRTRHEAVDSLLGVEIELFLDGAPVQATRGPIQPNNSSFARDSWEQFLFEVYGEGVVVGHIWGFQVGRVLAPDELSVGEHTLRGIVTETDTEIVFFDSELVFTVSPADSEACT